MIWANPYNEEANLGTDLYDKISNVSNTQSNLRNYVQMVPQRCHTVHVAWHLFVHDVVKMVPSSHQRIVKLLTFKHFSKENYEDLKHCPTPAYGIISEESSLGGQGTATK